MDQLYPSGQSIRSRKRYSDMNTHPDLPEDSDLDAMIAAPDSTRPVVPLVYVEQCPKCRGSGRFISWAGRDCGPCHTCAGKGTKTYKKSFEQRAATRAKSQSKKLARKEQDTARNLERFARENPDVWAWMKDSTYPFAVSMREAVAHWGGLTDRQLAASVTAMQKYAAIRAASAARIVDAKTIDMVQIEKAFSSASVHLKNPKLKVGDFVISHAKATSANAGSLYVREGDTYLGKITAAKFIRTRECTNEQEQKLITIAADPQAAAIAYGKLTGQCSCCGRKLTNHESIALGIGPICRAQWGWA